MADILNEFASAYKIGDTVRRNEEEKRLAEDTKNVFSDVVKNQDKYGGEAGAMKEAARRFGESGNVAGFQLATTQAAAFQAEKVKKQKEAMQHLGAAAIWLYGKQGDEKQKAYKDIYQHYSGLGIPMEGWPKPGEYRDEIGLSATGMEESRKFFDEIEYRKKMAEKPRGTTGKGGGKGSEEKHVSFAKSLMASGDKNPETGKPYTYTEALKFARNYINPAKYQTEDELYKALLVGGKYTESQAKAYARKAFATEAPAGKSELDNYLN